MVTYAEDNPFPYATFVESAAPATPAAGSVALFVDTADGLFKWKDDAGTVTPLAGSGIAATLLDAAGDLIVASAADTPARLALGSTNGMALQRVAGAVAWALPPGYEFDYVEDTSSNTVTNTTEATADTIVSANAVTFDGSTTILVECFCFYVQPPSTAANGVQFYIYDGSSSIGRIGLVYTPAANTHRAPLYVARRLTPSAASHTYSLRAATTGASATVGAGAGGNGSDMPAFIRITKV